jgi:hypothetical protein
VQQVGAVQSGLVRGLITHWGTRDPLFQPLPNQNRAQRKLKPTDMPSRKKAKGRARKAAKAAKEQAVAVANQDGSLEARMQRLTMDDLLRGNSGALQKCRHGFELEGREARLCFEFVKAFENALKALARAGDNDIASSLAGGTDATAEKFSSVWNDLVMMEHVVSFCLASGAQYILDGKEGAVRFNAFIACYFEQFIAVFHKETLPSVNMTLIAELQWADMNSLVNYFRKRIPCKCLDKRYKEVKSVIKMGLCHNPACSLPDRQVERKKMLCCTGCSRSYYCSYECQKAHWRSGHKEACKEWAREKAEFESGTQL